MIREGAVIAACDRSLSTSPALQALHLWPKKWPKTSAQPFSVVFYVEEENLAVMPKQRERLEEIEASDVLTLRAEAPRHCG